MREVEVSALQHIFNFGTAGSWNQDANSKCDENFGIRQHEVDRFLLLSNEQLKKHKCENCGKEYKWKQGLLNHVRMECGKDPQFHCDICTYKTHRKGNLTRHLILLHKMDPYMKK
ncbi:hypothetical protein ANN_25153 [Periplaneta americana]|uniref:C2H2-type domain-containing protein n=1 Tax=Periplaneta americana TaxID=6978 RepID=A0ABQ8S0V8_PERAM|nr:hypothetical protein ANN_25153 [Periplaneta americana]